MLEHILYHENSQTHSDVIQEDYYANSDNIFIVADGITLESGSGVERPKSTDSFDVAKIASEETLAELNKKFFNTNDIKNALVKANKKVASYLRGRTLYKNRERNGFMFGSTLIAVGGIINDRLLYGVLDDCLISVFSSDLIDHPIFKNDVTKTFRYFETHYDKSKTKDLKFFKKNLRNHKVVINGQTYGYGAIDGRKGFEQFIQLGEVTLKDNDLICIYSDGFIKPINDLDFVKTIYNSKLTNETLKYLTEYLRKNNISKEKTCYFIRYRK